MIWKYTLVHSEVLVDDLEVYVIVILLLSFGKLSTLSPDLWKYALELRIAKDTILYCDTCFTAQVCDNQMLIL